MEDLVQSIEEMREILHKMAITKGFRHPDVLTASRVLDQAISQYLVNEVDSERGDGDRNIEEL